MLPKNRRSIQVYCGPGINAAFDIFEPDMDVVTITGIAHALANQCRFNGQCTHFYSVAQHSLHVSKILETRTASKKFGLIGLLHDASEAYLADIPNPIKVSGLFDEYLNIEERIQSKIYAKFGIPALLSAHESELLREADIMALATERKFLMQPPVMDIWKKIGDPDHTVYQLPTVPPVLSERDFVKRFEELTA